MARELNVPEKLIAGGRYLVGPGDTVFIQVKGGWQEQTVQEIVRHSQWVSPGFAREPVKKSEWRFQLNSGAVVRRVDVRLPKDHKYPRKPKKKAGWAGLSPV